MIRYKIDKETPDYLTINKSDLLYLILFKDKVPSLSDAVRYEINKMMRKLCQFERSTKSNPLMKQINSFAFKITKESILGKYLLENTGAEEIIDYTSFINREDIKNALLIAIFEDDCKRTNKILPLFQNQFSGFKEDLLKEYPYYEATLDYILENNDFKKHLLKAKNIEMSPKEEAFLAYEDGVWTIKNPNQKPFYEIKQGGGGEKEESQGNKSHNGCLRVIRHIIFIKWMCFFVY